MSGKRFMAEVLSRGIIGVILILFIVALPASAEGPIKVGLIDTYSGRATAFTHPALVGWKMVVNDFNAKGGLGGRQIELITFDDKFNPETAMQGARELVETKKVDFLAGFARSECALAVSKYAKDNQKLLMVHIARSPKIAREYGHRYVFQAIAPCDVIGKAGGRYASYKRYRKWYIIGEDSEFGRDMCKAFWEELKQRLPRAKKVGEVLVSPRQKDYSSYIQAIKEAKPTAVFVGLGTTGMIPFAKQAKTAGLFDHTRVFLSGMADPVFPFVLKQDMPTKNAFGSGEFLWYWPKNKKVRGFVAEYDKVARKELGDKVLPPGFTAYDGYTTAKFLTEAIIKAGSVDNESVIDALEGLIIDTPTGAIEMRACDHQAAGKINWGEIRVLKGLTVPGLEAPHYLPLDVFLPTCEEVMRLRQTTNQ